MPARASGLLRSPPRMKSSFQNRIEPAREALSRPRSAPSPIALLTAALLAATLSCSGPEYATPHPEPEGTILRPPWVAQPDTLGCLNEGSEIPASVAGADAGPPPACCEGLTRVEVYKGSILRLDVCEPEGTGHAFCIRCGDGRCGVGENTCSCPADCHWP
jgi:hypothetical protein